MSTKSFKLCFNNQIHKLSKAPESYKALVEGFEKSYKEKLPSSWVLQYEDEEGDKIMLTNEADFQTLMESEAEGASKAVKIYLVELGKEQSVPSSEGTEYKSIEMTKSLEKVVKENEAYEVIDHKPEPKDLTYNVTLDRVVYTIPTRITTNTTAIYHTVSLKNSGTEAWPASCMFKCLSGVEGPDVKGVPLAPGKDFSCVLLLKNDGVSGMRSSTWALTYYNDFGMLQYVGEPFTVEFNVNDAESQEDVKEVLAKEDKVKEEVAKKNDEEKAVKKAQQIKEMFPFVDYAEILDFIRGVPEMSIEELAGNYIK